jgi:hypothetical protein
MPLPAEVIAQWFEWVQYDLSVIRTESRIHASTIDRSAEDLGNAIHLEDAHKSRISARPLCFTSQGLG